MEDIKEEAGKFWEWYRFIIGSYSSCLGFEEYMDRWCSSQEQAYNLLYNELYFLGDDGKFSLIDEILLSSNVNIMAKDHIAVMLLVTKRWKEKLSHREDFYEKAFKYYAMLCGDQKAQKDLGELR